MGTERRSQSIYPTLRYDDAARAVDFLTQTFGLGERMVVREDDGAVTHAELEWDGNVLMLSPRHGTSDPFDTGRAVVYLALDDPDAHHARAVAAGAEIVMELTDQEYGSREYAATDHEGNVWCFGTYRP